MDQDEKARLPIPKYTHTLTNKPPVVAVTRLKWFEKEIMIIEQQVRPLIITVDFVAFGPLIGFFVDCELHYLRVNYVTLV